MKNVLTFKDLPKLNEKISANSTNGKVVKILNGCRC